MKVLLIQAYTGRKEFGLIYPLGLACLAAALTTKPHQHEVRLFDPNTEPDPYGALSEVMHTFLPDIVGISQRNIDTCTLRDLYVYLKTLRPTLQLIRRLLPEVVMVVGGSGFSLFPKQIMQQIPEIDFGVHLEAEESFPELLANLVAPEKVRGIYYRKNGAVVFTGPRSFLEFDNMLPPRHDLLEINKYFSKLPTIGVETKRGCALKCVYCAYPHLNGPIVRLRNPKSVVDEIESLIKTYQIPSFFFVDSVFNIPKEPAVAVCQELIRRNITAVPWSAFYDIKEMDEEFIRLAISAGCNHFMFSPDAITAQSLAQLQKNFTTDDILATVKLFKKFPEVSAGFSLFLNTPGTTIGSYFKTGPSAVYK